MEFRTTIHTGDNNGIMHHNEQVMMLGSCFSDNIGTKLQNAMIKVDINPFGTLYNPLSIAEAVKRIINCESERGIDLFQGSGVWNSFNFHSRFSMADKDITLQRMNERIAEACEHLKSCHTLIITLGSAVVYRLKETGQVVANCHKVPQHRFTRQMATVNEMTNVLHDMVKRLQAFNAQLRIIFTVSPIRHLADGLDTNSLSKAALRVAINEVISRNGDNVMYFPAYEIMIDDLRDYRFYATDMVHPNETAINYIWQVFQGTYFDDASTQAIARCERVSKRLNHRPMNNNPEIVERFNADTAIVLRNLYREYPYLNQPS